MVNARSDFANSPVYGRLVGTIVQLVDAIAVSPNYAKERTTPVACMRIMKSSEISLALGRQAVNGFLEQTFIFEHPNLLVLLRCVVLGSGISRKRRYRTGADEQWPFGEDEISKLDVAFGEESLSHIRSRFNFIQVWAARFRDASWVAWGVEHFSFCRTIDDPFGSNLVVRNRLRYGGDNQCFLSEFSNSWIRLLNDDFGFIVEVIIAGKSCKGK